MNTLEKIEKALDNSKYTGFVITDDNGRFEFIRLARTSGHGSNQKVYLSNASRMTIKQITDEINSTGDRGGQKFIDTH